MMRIWLTEYDICHITGFGSMCGPDIPAPSKEVAEQMAKKIRKTNPEMRELRILGWKVGEVSCKQEIGSRINITPYWSTYVDFENIWMN